MPHTTNRYCAFLRGVNVNGTTMKMADVCHVFAASGMQDVSAVLASGNILFTTHFETTQAKPLIEKAMSKRFNYDAFLFIKDKATIASIVQHCPFTPDPLFHRYSFVGIEGVEQLLMQEFQSSEKTSDEDAAVVANHFYWKVPKGDTLASSFGKILGKAKWKDRFTSRNLNTFTKIQQKL